MRFFITFLFILSIVFLSNCSPPADPVLFPEREVVNKQSELFFFEISTGMPQLKNIPFFIKSKNYFSAYINLSRVLSKTPYFIKIFSDFENRHLELLERFNAIKQNISLSNYKSIQKESNFNDLEFYSIVLYKLFNEYIENNLSGNIAYNYWNIVLDISHKLHKPKLDWENYALLQITSNMFFLKKKEYYKSKSKQIKKKIKEKRPENLLLNYIINQGDI